MTPLPTNPNVLILINPEGKVEAIASNIAPDLKVVFTTDAAAYREEAKGKPFDSARN